MRKFKKFELTDKPIEQLKCLTHWFQIKLNDFIKPMRRQV